MDDIYGQRSCGTVAYTFKSDKLIAYQCHCSVCRKATGSAYSTTLMAPQNGFQWLRGETLLSSYTKENGYRHAFCSRCGSPMPNKFRGLPLFSVPAGSIEGDPLVDIKVQLFVASKANWEKGQLEGKQFDDMPSLREILELLDIHENP